MAQHERPDRSLVSTAARAIGQGIWVLIPIISLSFLAFVPATQTYWRARSSGWLIAMVILMLTSAGVATGTVFDFDSGAIGLMAIGGGLGGVVAALNGRPIVFAPPEEPAVDPAVQAVLDSRERRQEAREIASSDPDMALELGIGRPDAAGEYDDGGLIDLNNAPADAITRALDWPSEVAATLVGERESLGGYASMTEVMALSTIGHRWLERDADRIVFLPYQNGP